MHAPHRLQSFTFSLLMWVFLTTFNLENRRMERVRFSKKEKEKKLVE